MTTINSKRGTNFAVTLTPCNFKEHTYVARVPRRTVTSDQILDLVSAHNQGIDRYQVGHAMALLKKEILEQAGLGFAVDIMEICKLYIAPIASVTSLTPEAESVTGFQARFEANECLKEQLRGVTATVTAVVHPAPQISQIENPLAKEGGKAGTLKATFGVRIRGKKLKVGGKDSGIFFAPCLADGAMNRDESSWTKVPDEYLTRNTDQRLEFYIPRSIEGGGRYYIAVRTKVRGTNELKEAVTGYSKIAVAVED